MVPMLVSLCFDAQDPARLGQFWAAILQRDLADDRDGTVLAPRDTTQFAIRFRPSPAARTRPNRFHFDLTSASLEDQQAIVGRAISLGGEHIDIGQLPEERHVVLADPEGNEFCVIPPDNNFLADTDALGALAGDGTQRVGYFWADALTWPLVWDENEETAIQSPQGGTKITWGGPPVEPKEGVARLRFELAVPAEEFDAGVERLVGLGATRVGAATEVALPHDVADGVVLADPDGNEFSVGPS